METKEIMNETAMKRSLTRIAYEIIERNKGVDQIILVGIKTRGEILAKRISEHILRIEGKQVPYFGLDISYWRDDIKTTSPIPNINYSLQDKKIILVDDVLFKGRTVRAAMDAIMHYGRAKEIQLAVLIDRGHRELPIHANYIGKSIPSALNEQIRAKVKEIDGCEGVYLSKMV